MLDVAERLDFQSPREATRKAKSRLKLLLRSPAFTGCGGGTENLKNAGQRV